MTKRGELQVCKVSLPPWPDSWFSFDAAALDLFAFSLMLIAQLVWFGMVDVKKVKNTDKRRNLEATFSAYLSLQLPSMAHYRENMVAQNTAGHQLYNTVYTIHCLPYTIYTNYTTVGLLLILRTILYIYTVSVIIKTREVLGNPFLMPMTVGSCLCKPPCEIISLKASYYFST